jgi:hypothetical protein
MFTISRRLVPKLASNYFRKNHGPEYSFFQQDQDIDHIIARRKPLKSYDELQKEFANANRIDHEKKVTEYWNYFRDEIVKQRCGYFMVTHPTADIRNEIIQIAFGYGYKVEFKKDCSACYVVINGGKI